MCLLSDDELMALLGIASPKICNVRPRPAAARPAFFSMASQKICNVRPRPAAARPAGPSKASQKPWNVRLRPAAALPLHPDPNQEEQKYDVPYEIIIPGDVYPGRIVVIKGITLLSASQFAINFLSGSRDIAFHFNTRFGYLGHHWIVRNSYLNGSWGAEETAGRLPLVKGEPFEAVIECTHSHFQVSLEGKHFCEYAYRLPYFTITHFQVVGDVFVQQISYEGCEPPHEMRMLAAEVPADADDCQ